MLKVGIFSGTKPANSRLIKVGPIIAVTAKGFVAEVQFNESSRVKIDLTTLEEGSASAVYREMQRDSLYPEVLKSRYRLWLLDKGNGNIVASIRFTSETDKLWGSMKHQDSVLYFYRLPMDDRVRLMKDSDKRLRVEVIH